MKRTHMLIACALAAGVAGAATMRPATIAFGEVRDSFGIRLTSDAQVSAFRGTNEVARTAAGVYPGGVTYRVMLDVYDPLTATAGQVTPGDLITIRVKTGVSFPPLIGTNTFAAPGDGSCVRRDLILGEDTDGDGLPDAWEWMVIANSGGAATDLNDVGPGLDLDGDGMNDDTEFWYGTFAFLPGDELKVQSMRMEGERYAFRFLTVLGAVYRVESNPSLSAPVWTTCPVAMSADGPVATQEFLGDGDFMTIYILPTGDRGYYRLKAK